MRFLVASFVTAFLAGIAVASPIDLEERQTGCAPLIHINAAGTSERGLGLVGTAMQQSLPAQVSGATVQALDYSTSAEYFYSVAAGARTLASLLSTLSSRCPNAKFSLSGYSKGALVMHRTTLSSSIQPKVVAVAVFGDPQQSSGSRGIPINNVACFFQYCHDRDQFCDSPGTLGPHLTYARDGDVADSASKIAACYRAAL